jgi:lipoate-protein ligase A
MALDEALMGRARATGECVLRVYSWSAPTLSLGRHQVARGAYDDVRAAARGVAIVRRPTGGRAVLHHREVTYSVTAPADVLGGLATAYGVINSLVVSALRRLGVAAEIAEPSGRALPPSPVPCFALPAAGEITVGGRKLVGSAQWRDRGALLQHGSILVEDDQALAAELSCRPGCPASPVATLKALLGYGPSPAEVGTVLRATLREYADVAPLMPDAALASEAGRLAARYRDPGWTWRR